MVIVTTTDRNTFEIEEATSWHIKDTGSLHLMNATHNPVASFAPLQWVAAVVSREAAESSR